MLRGKTYEEVYQNSMWKIPRYYNIGVDVCDKWAKPWVTGDRFGL